MVWRVTFSGKITGVIYILTVTKPGVWSTRQLGKILCVVLVQSYVRRRNTIPRACSFMP